MLFLIFAKREQIYVFFKVLKLGISQKDKNPD